MKFFTAISFMFLALCLNAQTLWYSDESIEFEGETVDAVVVKLDPDVSTIRDKFEDWMNDNYDVDLDGKKLIFFNKDHLKASGVQVDQISNKKLDLFAKVDESQSGITTLNVFASFGYNNWITPIENPMEYFALREIVYEFVEEYLPEYYAERLDERQEKLEDLNEKRVDMQEELRKNKEEIEKLQKDNNELLEKLKTNQDRIYKARQKVKTTSNNYKEVQKKVNKMK